jgi:UDP-glucose 4-epimerase
MSGKRVLITGGFGNLGLWLTNYFASRDYRITILSKNINIKLDKDYRVIQADITDIGELREKLKDIEFDYIIHTASYNEYFHKDYAKKALLVNTLGTRNLIDVLKDKNIKRFIYLSTFHIYGLDSGIITEDTPPNPKNDYASTHLFAEYYLKQFGESDEFPYIIFRLTNSYGSPKYINSSKWYLVLNDLTKSAFIKKKILLRGNGKAIRDFIWSGDVCSVIEKSFHFKAKEIFNLSSNQTYSMYYIAKEVQRVYKKRYAQEIEIILNSSDKTPSKNLIVDNSRLKQYIDIEFSNKFQDEVESIFNLLELQNG